MSEDTLRTPLGLLPIKDLVNTMQESFNPFFTKIEDADKDLEHYKGIAEDALSALKEWYETGDCEVLENILGQMELMMQ